jgi:hypothetical protein
MNVGSILNLLNELNTIILCESFGEQNIFYLMSSISSIIRLQEYIITFITYPPKKLFKLQKNHFSLTRI